MDILMIIMIETGHQVVPAAAGMGVLKSVSGEAKGVFTMKKLDMKRNRFYKIVKDLGI